MKKLIMVLIGVFLVQNLVAQRTYILCGKLIDTKTGEIYKKKTILWEVAMVKLGIQPVVRKMDIA